MPNKPRKPRQPKPPKKYLRRYRPRVLLEEQRVHRLINYLATDDPMLTPEEIACRIGATTEIVKRHLNSREYFDRRLWLDRFEQNQIDPFNFGHA